MPTIHPSADVHRDSHLAEDVTVGAGAVIEQHCRIGAGCVIGRHSIIWQGTQIGDNNRIFPFCSIGGEPQDKKYRGEAAPLIIGDDNTIREYCFINKGTDANGETRIGHRNWIMGYVHIAHDCILADDITIANTVQMAGHVVINRGATIGGGTLFHQFCRVGDNAMIGGGEAMRHDTPPFALYARGTIAVNGEGMRRNGYADGDIDAMQQAYRLLYRAGLPFEQARDNIAALPHGENSPLPVLTKFLQQANLNLIRPRRQSS